MRDAHRCFWRRCESQPPLLSYDEVFRWEPEGRNQLLNSGLLQEAELATGVECDSCFDPHWEEVVWVNSVCSPTGRKALIRCPTEGAVEVSEERLRQWAPNFPVLVRTLSRAMELSGSVEKLVSGRVWVLGRRHLAGRYREVFLVIGVLWPDSLDLYERAHRVTRSPAPIILVPKKLPSREPWRDPQLPVFSIGDLSTMASARLALDVAFIEDALPRDQVAPRPKVFASFPVPDDARWEELRLEIRETALVATLRGTRKELSFERCGFTDRRQGETTGDLPWQTLQLFARNAGVLGVGELTTTPAQRSRLQTQIRSLRRHLRALFPIDGNPIRNRRSTARYECVFGVGESKRVRLPVPHDASWLDIRMVELPNGRIQVGLKSRETFAAKGQFDGHGRRERETAERQTTSSFDYALSDLGLEGRSGQPTSDGRTLRAFLRSGGQLSRPGDDMSVLRLAQRLREWSGLESEPFQFCAADQSWVASFECGSEPVR